MNNYKKYLQVEFLLNVKMGEILHKMPSTQYILYRVVYLKKQLNFDHVTLMDVKGQT